jgi:hypothetical protein
MALYGKNYLYGIVWHCMAKNSQKVYDNVWHCMAFLICMAKHFLLHFVRQCMALYGIFKMYDNVWHCMAKMNEKCMALYGNNDRERPKIAKKRLKTSILGIVSV